MNFFKNQKIKLFKILFIFMISTILLEAKINIIQDNYKNADKNYKKALVYNRSYKNLLKYAYFLQKQNQISKSISYYKEALKVRRDLAKQNPKAYNFDVAITLNNIANLYKKNNQLKEAKKAYFEALKIRRDLAKQNPKAYNSYLAITLNNLAVLYSDNNQLKKTKEVYLEALKLYKDLAKQNPRVSGIDYVRTIIIGVTLLKEPKSNLKEAKKYLKIFKNNLNAKQLLKIIKRLDSNKRLIINHNNK
jgi:tetratricopeptide (TPR) repeat protein